MEEDALARFARVAAIVAAGFVVAPGGGLPVGERWGEGWFLSRGAHGLAFCLLGLSIVAVGLVRHRVFAKIWNFV